MHNIDSLCFGYFFLLTELFCIILFWTHLNNMVHVSHQYFQGDSLAFSWNYYIYENFWIIFNSTSEYNSSCSWVAIVHPNLIICKSYTLVIVLLIFLFCWCRWWCPWHGSFVWKHDTFPSKVFLCFSSMVFCGTILIFSH